MFQLYMYGAIRNVCSNNTLAFFYKNREISVEARRFLANSGFQPQIILRLFLNRFKQINQNICHIIHIMEIFKGVILFYNEPLYDRLE